jgi:Protein of Unknown function (DUF2784)
LFYRCAADALVVLHLAFVGFVVLGGLSVFRWPRVALAHVPAIMWAVLLELNGWLCPLTPWEQQLRLAAGEAGYAGGFIAHYLLPVIYPEGLTRNVQLVLAGVVVAVNAGVYGLIFRKQWTARGTGVKHGDDSSQQG